MRRIIFVIPAILTAFLLAGNCCAGDGCKAVYGSGAEKLTLATGSPGELGLVKVLADHFNKEAGTTIRWVKAGSGKSLKLLKAKKADVVMVHAPAAEKKALKDGWATKRTLIGSNEFYIVGPANDPAGIAKAKTAAQAYADIARAEALFFSRGDNSGTHRKEMFIWVKSGVKPEGSWYVVTRDFMRATLRRANADKGYFMTDSSTWVAERKNLPNLKVLFRGDPILINVYHALCQPKGATPAAGIAAQFVDFVASKEGTRIIGEYGKSEYGDGLYHDADYAGKYDH
jgi:tungstate transport system substrate-binding protein